MSFKTSYVSNKSAEIFIRSAQNPSKVVSFPAFVTSFTNSFSSQWNEEQVYGRIDPIGTFQGTKRSISLGFDIVSYDADEARGNMKSINAMTQMLYPSYAEVQQELSGGVNRNALILSKAPLVEIKFANLIKDFGSEKGWLLGWIGTWSANPVLEMGMFTPNKTELLPKVYNASLDFTPQHRGDLKFNSTEKSKAKFPYDGG